MPVTIAAASAQVFRNGAQAGLTKTLGMLGATQVRFVFGLPFALLFLAAALWLTGQPLPGLTRTALGWAALGAVCQFEPGRHWQAPNTLSVPGSLYCRPPTMTTDTSYGQWFWNWTVWFAAEMPGAIRIVTRTSARRAGSGFKDTLRGKMAFLQV